MRQFLLRDEPSDEELGIIFHTPLSDYNALIRLQKSAVPRYAECVQFSPQEKVGEKQLLIFFFSVFLFVLGSSYYFLLPFENWICEITHGEFILKECTCTYDLFLLLQTHAGSQFKNLALARKKPHTTRVHFDAVELYLRDLRAAYGHSCMFFYDAYGGDVIGVVFDPQV